MRFIAWLFLILLAATLIYLSWEFQHFNPFIPTDFSFETADQAETRRIVEIWQISRWGQHNVITGMTLFTVIDFAYIIVYSYVLVTLSYDRMQREGNVILNNFLRLNFPIAILAGLFDVIENVLFLFNMEHFDLPDGYVSIAPFTYIKWTLIALVALILVVSKVKGWLTKWKN